MTKYLDDTSGTSPQPWNETDVLDLRPSALVTPDDRRATIEELRLKCERRITEFFSGELEGVLNGYKELALHAEKESVREKASRKIIDTFKRPALPAPAVPSVLIQNNTLVPEMAVMNGKQVQVLETPHVRVALTGLNEARVPPDKRPRLIGPEPTGTKSLYSEKNTEVPEKAKDVKRASGPDKWQDRIEVKP